VRFEDIAGHATAKRALEVAVAGGHSILLVGPRGAGKDSLLATLDELDPECKITAKAVLPCWCGADDMCQPCQCSERAKARYARRMRAMSADFDMVLEVCPVPVKEYGSRMTRGTTAEALARALPVHTVQTKRGQQSLEALMQQLDEPGRRTFEMAVRRLAFGCGDTARVMRVARTIADLSGDKHIPARALAEAVQYKALAIYRS
jgi:magnesium chelatase family protein